MSSTDRHSLKSHHEVTKNTKCHEEMPDEMQALQYRWKRASAVKMAIWCESKPRYTFSEIVFFVYLRVLRDFVVRLSVAWDFQLPWRKTTLIRLIVSVRSSPDFYT